MGIKMEMWQDFCRTSTIHAMPHVGAAAVQHFKFMGLVLCRELMTFIGQRPSLASFWSILLVFSTIAAVIQINLLITYYHNDPSYINASMTSRSFTFPSVTFCNLNAYKQSALAKAPQLQELMKALNMANKASDKKAKDERIAAAAAVEKKNR